MESSQGMTQDLVEALVQEEPSDEEDLLAEALAKATDGELLPAARGGQTRAVLKRRTAGRVEESIHDALRLCLYTHKSYILRKVDNTWLHQVTVTDTQSADHAEVMVKLMNFAKAHVATKEEIIEKKNEWLSALNAGAELKDLGSDAEADSSQ